MGPDGTLVSRFEKVHRVPFGEYVPERSFFAHLANLSAVSRDAVPGTGTGLLPTPAAQVPTQEIAAAEVQAVQQGRDLLQAAPTGYSAAITNRGTLLERSALGAQQAVFATLSRRAGWTLYVRFGDLPVEVGASVALVGAWLLAGRRNRVGAPGRRARGA